MTRYIATLLLLTSCTLAHAQKKTMQIPYARQWDTLEYKLSQYQNRQMQLADLTTSVDLLHFRFWTETQALDIWTNDLKTFSGTLTNVTSRYDADGPFGGMDTSRIYTAQKQLDTATACTVYNLFASHAIFNIPTRDSINGWSMGCDGEEFVMEYATPSFYSYKDYWTPSAFKKIREAVVINQLAKDLEAMLHMSGYFHDFVNTLPEGTYRAGELLLASPTQPRKRHRG